MSAADHFGPQLQMFIPAGAFEGAMREKGGNFFQFGDALPVNTESVKGAKIAEGKRGRHDNAHAAANYTSQQEHGTFYENVQREGVREPVSLHHGGGGKTLTQGHHRVFVSADIDPTREVPVIHGGIHAAPGGGIGSAYSWYPTESQVESVKRKRQAER